MSNQLSGSVGVQGQNSRNDVLTVQRLLKSCGVSPGAIDGRCGPLTVNAILTFQHVFLHNPDGRVDINGITWRHLNGKGTQQPVRPRAIQPSTPQATQPAQDLVPPPAFAADKALTATLPKKDFGSYGLQINQGVQDVSVKQMKALFGEPRLDGKYPKDDDNEVTNPKLKRNMVYGQKLGPQMTVNGLKPAVESLRAIMQDIKNEQPAVYQVLASHGMLNCRLKRSKTSLSNHAWGVAIDLRLKISGKFVHDSMYDNGAMVALALIAPIFNRHKWFWGINYKPAKGATDDAMHFQGGFELMKNWASQLS